MSQHGFQKRMHQTCNFFEKSYLHSVCIWLSMRQFAAKGTSWHVCQSKTVGLDKQNFQHKIVNNFLPISFSISFGFSKELFH